MATIFDLGSHLGGERELGLGMPFWASAVSSLSYHAFDGVRTVLVVKDFADTTCPPCPPGPVCRGLFCILYFSVSFGTGTGEKFHNAPRRITTEPSSNPSGLRVVP